MKARIVKDISLTFLKPHEKVSNVHVVELMDQIQKSRHMEPLLVDKQTGVILDGHHRFHAAKNLNLKKIPCLLIDYLADSSIVVLPRRKHIRVTKEHVIRMGLSKEVFPYKTTKHLFL